MSETVNSGEDSSPKIYISDSSSNPDSVSTSSTSASTSGAENEILSELSRLISSPGNLQIAANYLYETIIDDLVLGIVFDLHYRAKMGITKAIEGEPEDPNLFMVHEEPDCDVFGVSTSAIKKTCDCTCPNCERLVAASRFAPHLEKCMGMGRNSSRIASRRIASARGEGTSSSYFISISDDEDDADWAGERKRKKNTNCKNGMKRTGKSSS